MTPSSTVRDGHELIILGEKDDRFYETSGTTCPGTQSHIIEEQNPQRYRCESLKLRSLARVIDKPCTKVGTMRCVLTFDKAVRFWPSLRTTWQLRNFED